MIETIYEKGKIIEFGEALNRICGRCKAFIVTDENVAPLYLDEVANSLKSRGFDVGTFVLQRGEASKSKENLFDILETMAEENLTKSDCVIALGGGVVGDISGLAASIYMRGIKICHIPTTVMSYVDSSVGGKTAVNLSSGKNLVGSFWSPLMVFQDVNLIRSLDEREKINGIFEIIKYGVVADRQLFDTAMDRERLYLNFENVLDRCVNIKRSFVERDFRDEGCRKLLNFGHTLGHALEKISDYKIAHGTAVAFGMEKMALISARKGWCGLDVYDEIYHINRRYDVSLFSEVKPEDVLNVVLLDKKRSGEHIDLIIPERIGRCKIKRVSVKDLNGIINW